MNKKQRTLEDSIKGWMDAFILDRRIGNLSPRTIDFYEEKLQWDFVFFLNLEVWDAFSDGGELEWIKDPELLRMLSDIYHQLKELRFRVRSLYPGTAGGKKQIQSTFPPIIPSAITAVEDGLKKIDEVLGD